MVAAYSSASGTSASPVRRVKVRRIAQRPPPRSAALSPKQHVETALARVCSGSPALVSAVRALVAVADFLQRAKESIRYFETTGGQNAGRALKRRAIAAGRAVTETVERKREDWSAAHARRRARLRVAIESRKVTHCREWAAW